MLKNIKIIIEYDGSLFSGWQRQKSRRTIQGEIENALEIMTGLKVALIGSGRTDAGVHALGQVANFHCDTNIEANAFLRGLNSLLPDEIVIKKCSQVNESFHSRYDAKHKTYIYRVLNSRIPAAICRKYFWLIKKQLDTDAIQSANAHLIGTYDFKSFEGAGSPKTHTVRNITRAEIVQKDSGYIIFKFEADGFLRFMVRNIVGTLVDVGQGKITPRDFKKIVLSKDRNMAGVKAPARGLFLLRVDY